jgi:hypothetical protein
VSPGDEFETFITGADDGVLIGYVDDTPIHFPDGGAEVGQKVAGEVVGFADDRIIADITEAYDEVGRTQNSSHWARMKWLGQADTAFQNEPLRTVVAQFTGAASENLPTDADRLQQILVAEAIRLALQDKATDSDETYPRAHITGLRHWVIQKLSPLLGEPTTDEDEEGDDWFRNVLTDGPGPTLTFLGDILSLSNGYYAPGPTRAIKRGAETAVLVSGRPSQWFVKNGYELEFRGVSRVIDGTPLDTVADAGIPIQSLEEYLGTENFGTSWLEDFIDARDTQEWTPESEWQPYVGHRGYGFEWGDDALRVELDGTRIVSLWKVPVEYGADEYQLKIDTSDEATAKMVTVPLQYYKQVAIMLDAIAGVPRRVKLSGHGEKIRLSCNFSPPRAQMRWLTAIGARWIGPEGGHIHWRIDRSDISSVEEAFEQVAVKLDTAVTRHNTQ